MSAFVQQVIVELHTFIAQFEAERKRIDDEMDIICKKPFADFLPVFIQYSIKLHRMTTVSKAMKLMAEDAKEEDVKEVFEDQFEAINRKIASTDSESSEIVEMIRRTRDPFMSVRIIDAVRHYKKGEPVRIEVIARTLFAQKMPQRYQELKTALFKADDMLDGLNALLEEYENAETIQRLPENITSVPQGCILMNARDHVESMLSALTAADGAVGDEARSTMEACEQLTDVEVAQNYGDFVEIIDRLKAL